MPFVTTASALPSHSSQPFLAEGATFARLFAAGDRAIVAHHQGRFGVGGFGLLFDGIYLSPLDATLQRLYDRLGVLSARHGLDFDLPQTRVELSLEVWAARMSSLAT